MKLIIAGSRDFNDYDRAKAFIKNTLHYWFHNHITGNYYFPTEIVSGGATGADKLGERYAEEMKFKIKLFIPDWQKHGRSAGPIRNKEMAGYADVLIAFWDGESRGTKNMIETMERMNKPVSVDLIHS